MQRLNHSGQERRDHRSPSGLIPEKKIHHGSFQTFDLQFNVEKRLAVPLQNIAQPRELRHLLRGNTFDLIPPSLGIMADHCFKVRREPYIKFKSVPAVRQSTIE